MSTGLADVARFATWTCYLVNYVILEHLWYGLVSAHHTPSISSQIDQLVHLDIATISDVSSAHFARLLQGKLFPFLLLWRFSFLLQWGCGFWLE